MTLYDCLSFVGWLVALCDETVNWKDWINDFIFNKQKKQTNKQIIRRLFSSEWSNSNVIAKLVWRNETLCWNNFALVYLNMTEKKVVAHCRNWWLIWWKLIFYRLTYLSSSSYSDIKFAFSLWLCEFHYAAVHSA